MWRNLAILAIFILSFADNNLTEANLNINMNCGRSSAFKFLTLSTPTNSIPNICKYTIRASSLFVCQLRIDFDINLLPPKPTTTNTLVYQQCVDDVLEIGGFRLCGTDTNQHIYIPFNRTAGDTQKDITITTIPRTAGVAAPTWNIRVTQLECSIGSPLRSLANGFSTFFSNMLPNSMKSRAIIGDGILPRTFFLDGFKIAPNGCTQYYPEQSGSITSFNYNNGKGVYPGNMRYSICFRRNSNTQTLQLTVPTFTIGFEEGTTGALVNENCYGQIATVNRNEDFLMIPSSTIKSSNVRAFYYCGNVLNNEVVTSNAAGPLSIVFNSDTKYLDKIPETGFKIDYIIS